MSDAGDEQASEAPTRQSGGAGSRVGGGVGQAVELAYTLGQRAEHDEVVHALAEPATGGHGDLKRRGMAHEAGLLRQMEVGAGELTFVPLRGTRHRWRGPPSAAS